MLQSSRERMGKGSAALQIFGQQSFISSLETQLQDANRKIKELELLLATERARTKRLEEETRRLTENWRSAFHSGVPNNRSYSFKRPTTA